MSKIEWNEVTWYSKGLAIILFVATFAVAFALGEQWGVAHYFDTPAVTETATTTPTAPAKTTTTSTPAPAPAHTPTTASKALVVGKSEVVNGTTILVIELTEDSRCPSDVQCIQAGTVRVRAAIDSYNKDFNFILGVPQTVGGATITLKSVTPASRTSRTTLIPSQYTFTFSVTK
jgi:hypothetical protein